MKSTLRTIFTLLFLAGWSLAALSLYVVRLPDGAVGALPKNHLSISDTYLDTRPWTAADLSAHADFVKRVIEADRVDWLKPFTDPAKGDVATQLIELLAPPPPPPTTAAAKTHAHATIPGRPK